MFPYFVSTFDAIHPIARVWVAVLVLQCLFQAVWVSCALFVALWSPDKERADRARKLIPVLAKWRWLSFGRRKGGDQ